MHGPMHAHMGTHTWAYPYKHMLHMHTHTYIDPNSPNHWANQHSPQSQEAMASQLGASVSGFSVTWNIFIK